MKHTLQTLLILALLSLSAAAQSIITTTVTVTNAAPIGSTYTFNASTRTFATNFSSTTIQTNATIGGTATNLFLHLISSVPSGPVRISMPATNQVAIEGALNQAITASLLTNWGTIAYSTQAVQAAFSVRVPMSAEPTATNRVRFSSWLVEALRDYPTNSFPGTAFALTNFLSTTNNGRTISGSNTFTGANVFSNSGQSIVGGTISNAVFVGGNITNNGANAFRGTNTFGTIVASNITGSRLTSPIISGSAAGFILTNTTTAGFSVALFANSTNLVIQGPDYAGDSILIGPELGIVPSAANGLSLGGSGGAWRSLWMSSGGSILEANGIIFTNRGFTNLNTVHATNIMGGIFNSTATNLSALHLTNAAAIAANPATGVSIQSVTGDPRYRGTNESGGATHYLHNRTSEVIGSGSDYSLTTTYALVDFGGTDVEFNTLPTSGTYLLTATVAVNVGANTGDDFAFKFYNATDAADVANSEQVFDGTGHSGILQLTLSTVISVTSGKRIQIYGKNGSGNRGSVSAIYTKAIYVRLY